MASAYTPGLTVSGDIIVRRTRRLPIKGTVLVKEGETVSPDQVIARANLPGPLQTMKLADKMGVEPRDIETLLRVKVGDKLEKNDMVAESKGFFGMFKSTVLSEYTGTVETISSVAGSILIREAEIPVERSAYIQGKIAEVLPEEGVIVETRGAMIQGIFGVGGERKGILKMAVEGPDQVIHADNITDADAGKILVSGAGFSYDAIVKASNVGVAGMVGGGVKDSDLIKFLGYDIGVAITGQEQINLTLMVTEGFGFLNMAHRTFELLKGLEGKEASINGATQIRAGVIRPEVIVPLPHLTGAPHEGDKASELTIGTPIRVIREPYFGQLGSVTDLPSQLMVVDSGTEVRVLKAKLDGGHEVLVPRANVEIIAT